jgi:hypothetical protein
VPQAGQHLDRVGLDSLARTAPVALLAPAQVLVDARAVEDEARRESLDDGDERWAVRFACGRQPERHCASVIRCANYLRFDETFAVGERDCLCAAPDAELAEAVVGFDAVAREE